MLLTKQQTPLNTYMTIYYFSRLKAPSAQLDMLADAALQPANRSVASLAWDVVELCRP